MKEKAYAKINLFLNVTNKRIDGFHDLEMVMASLNLHDVLTFEKTDKKDIVVETSVKVTPSPKYNIVYKVAKFLQDEFEVESGVKIHIEKNIPLAAGLGGGSADAAATFRGLNKLWKLKLSLDDMAKLGESFGADIPFCIYNKLCIARGKGEELVFFKSKLRSKVLLVNPNIEVLTKDVFDKVTIEDINLKRVSELVTAINKKDYPNIIKELYNSLEKQSFEIEPKIREIKNNMIDAGIKGSLMCGSGGTVFGLSKDKKKLNDYAESLSRDYTVILTSLR